MNKAGQKPNKKLVPDKVSISRPTFFEACRQNFEEAAFKTSGIIDYHYELVGHSLLLRLAGNALVPIITPAIEHLIAPAAILPSLTVYLWDATSTGITLPPSILKKCDYVSGDDMFGIYSHHFFCLFNFLSQEVIFYIPNDKLIPQYQIAAPLLTIFHWWMREKGYQLAHSAAVGNQDGGILLTGKSGSGKSTAALACLESPLYFMSDDFVVFHCEKNDYFAETLYSSAKLNKKLVSRFPHLTASMNNLVEKKEEEKWLLFLNQDYKNKIIKQFPIKAVVVSRFTDGQNSHLSEISTVSALSAMAPSTMLQLADADERDFENIKRLVQSRPCFQLETGKDLSQIPEVIDNLLKKL